MPTIKVEQALLHSIVAAHGVKHEVSKLMDELPLLGTDISRCDDKMLEVEIFPDRPDLLCGETLAHAIRPFIYGSDAQPTLVVESGDISMDIDASLENVRPIILGAVVRGVNCGVDEEEKEKFIKAMMDHQEKLHFALGRGRRKASIGVHDLATLSPPFRVITVPADYSFIPLQMSKPMSISEILTSHEKGVDYAHLLEGFTHFPVIIDSKNKVLSFPPIINGDHTTITHSTNDFFIDVTGWDQRACECCLLLICLQLAARGGKVESVKTNTWAGEQIDTPDGSAVIHQIPNELVVDILGHDFNDIQLAAAIGRMGGRFLGRQPDKEPAVANKPDTMMAGHKLLLEMPRWRFDILHPIDLVEELAIGHGYEDLGSQMPQHPTSAHPRPDAIFFRRLRECLQGLGLQQVQSLTLSNHRDQFDAPRWQMEGEATRIHNPITSEHTLMRQSILPGLLRLLSANRHHELPQRVYESGICIRGHANCNRAAWLCAEPVSSFASGRGMMQALLRDLGAVARGLEVEWQTMNENEGPWMAGRAAKIIISGTQVAEMGEVDPLVADSFGLRVPMHGAELDIDALRAVIPDPVT